jgi:hypothetical protein
VAAFHPAYLDAAASVSRAGRLRDASGEPVPVGGLAWFAAVTKAGLKFYRLGHLDADAAGDRRRRAH